MSEQTAPSAEQWQADQMRRAVARIVADLRRLGDEVEREANAIGRVGELEFNTYGYAASQIIHAVTWGMANLSLERIAQCAADADAARAREQAAAQAADSEKGVDDGNPDTA